MAGLFAHYYPEYIHKLALLCPAIKTPILTETCQELLAGNFDLLIPKNGKQFIKMIGLLCQKQQMYPSRIMQSFVNLNFTLERQHILKKRNLFISTLSLSKPHSQSIRPKELSIVMFSLRNEP